MLIEQGVDTFIEIGSGSVLTGLIKKTDKTVKLFNMNSLRKRSKQRCSNVSSSSEGDY